MYVKTVSNSVRTKSKTIKKASNGQKAKILIIRELMTGQHKADKYNYYDTIKFFELLINVVQYL